MDHDVGFIQDAVVEGGRGHSRCAAELGEVVEHFGQHLFRDADCHSAQQPAGRIRRGMPLILIVEEGDPEIGIGEDFPHETGCFGAP